MSDPIKEQKRAARLIQEFITMPVWTTVLEPYLIEESNRLMTVLVNCDDSDKVREYQYELRGIKRLIAKIMALKDIKP